MPLFFLPLLGFLKSAASAIVAWLSRRSLAEILLIASAMVALVEFVGLRAEKRHSAKLQTQIEAYKRQLVAITSAKSEQRTITKDRIVRVTKIVHDADGRAKIVEQAPLPGNCKTPPAIMGADL